MHQSVVEHFVEFTVPLEGVVPSMYLDVKGLVTVGIGCLIDPVSTALGLPWVFPDGSRPVDTEVARQWRLLKARQDLAKLHWKYAAAITTIRLTDEGIHELAHKRMLANETELRKRFYQWDEFPADAQLCCMSMAWAVGAGFPAVFPNFTRAANAGNWGGAMAACAINADHNPGIVPRNAQNRLCLANAATASARGLPTDTLFWPDVVPMAPPEDTAEQGDAKFAMDDWLASFNPETPAENLNDVDASEEITRRTTPPPQKPDS